MLSLSYVPHETVLEVLSFLDYPDQCRSFRICKMFAGLRNQAERNLYSRINDSDCIFGRAEWERYWGAKITDQYDPKNINPEVLGQFLKIYYGRNPIGPGLVKDACLTVTVVPTEVYIEGKGLCDFNLNVLGELAEHPKKGPAAQYHPQDTYALEQHGDAKAERASLDILLGDVVAHGRPWSQESENFEKIGQVQYLKELNGRTGYGCETEPDALSQNTVLFAHHAFTKKRAVGLWEGQFRYGRTKELVRFGLAEFHMLSGGFRCTGPFGGSGPARLGVSRNVFEDEASSVWVMRKF